MTNPPHHELHGAIAYEDLPTARTFRFFPKPIYSVVLLAVWLLLVNSLHPRMILLGVVFGIMIPWYSHAFLPLAPRIHSWGAGFRFLPVFLYDIVIANFSVAATILRFWKQPNSVWLHVPLDIRDPFGVVTLANVISLTPGTVSSRLNGDRTALLVHALHVDDPAAEVANIKARYEKPLMEVFEP
jgi:multicomponent K+:H+ antiporter subunit E